MQILKIARYNILVKYNYKKEPTVGRTKNKLVVFDFCFCETNNLCLEQMAKHLIEKV